MNTQVRSGYKLTEVGAIPEDWECVQSADLATYFGGNAFKSEAAVSNGIKWLKIANVGKQRTVWDAASFLPQPYATVFKDYLLGEGDVVMALTRPILDDELKVAKLTKLDIPSLLNQRVAKVIASSRADLDFVYYILQTRRFVDSMSDAMAGSDPPNIGSKALGKILVAAPKYLTEQRAIAAALSDMDALISGLDQLIAKKRDIKQAAMQQLLTGQQRLPGFSGEWETKTFEEIFTFLPTAINARSDLTDSGDTYYIHYGDIHTRFHSHLNLRFDQPPKIERTMCRNAALIRNGDWVMADASEDFAGVGKTIEVSGLSDNSPMVAGLHTFLLREKTPTFSAGFKGHLGNLESLHQQYLRVATGMKVYGVSKAALKNLVLPVPTLKEQTAITTILSDMDSELTTLETRREKARQLKQGMMQELLTGRIRLSLSSQEAKPC